MTVRIARVYDLKGPDSSAILVDRLWPRGISKATAPFGEWMKDVAPSTELRQWYGHRPELFKEFARRYRKELGSEPARDLVATLRRRGRRGRLTLVTATKDVDISAAEVLRDVLTRS